MGRRFWLVKSEPDVYSIEDLERDGVTFWNGVRNYAARNFMRDDMRVGDRVLFYHSNAKPSCVVGIAEVVREGYPDHTALDPSSPYHDPKATKENPIWSMVDIRFVARLPRPVSLQEIRENPALEGIVLRNSRWSVQPVSDPHYLEILRMAGYQG